jgi:beta-glucosidase
MRFITGCATAMLLLWSGIAAAQPTPKGADCPALPRRFPMPREASAEQPNSDDWHARVQALTQKLAANTDPSPDIVFLGDSITEIWDPTLYKHFFGRYTTLNLGVSSDLTQSMLWRLDNGQWGNLHPKLAVLLIGTNDLSFNSRPEDVALGVAELVRFIHTRSPATKVLILGLLPRGAQAADPQRGVLDEVNIRIRRCADDTTTFYAEPGRQLLDDDGSMSFLMSLDLLHPTQVGYAILGSALEPTLQRLLGPGKRPPAH